MKNISVILLTCAIICFNFNMAVVFADTPKKAIPANSKVLVNEKEVELEAYNIEGSNYFKLRDIAMAINNTAKNFNVQWDETKNALNIISNKPYTVVGDELKTSETRTEKAVSPSNSSIYLDGSKISPSSYLIDNNNYFKLRDICNALSIDVDWISTKNTIAITSSVHNNYVMASTDNSSGVNTAFTGSLEAESTVNSYKFKLDNPGKVWLTFSHDGFSSAKTYWIAGLYDSKNARRLTLHSTGNDTKKDSSNLYLPSGEYVVKVEKGEYNWSWINYELKVNYEANSSGKYEVEDNDTLELANVINTNSEISGSFWHDKDVDQFTFDLKTPGKVWLVFSHENLNSAKTYWIITLYDSSETKHLVFHSNGDETKKGSINAYLPAGKYFVKVEKGYYYWSSIDYGLKVNYESNANKYEIEDNNAAQEANQISTDTEVIGNLGSDKDVDYFVFDLADSREVSIAFEHNNLNSTKSHWSIGLHDSNDLQRLVFYSNGDETKKGSINLFLPAGKYFVKIERAESWSWIDYILKVNTN